MERWKDIPGYEGLYQASDTGQIRTREGKTTSSARFPRRVWKQRVLKQKWRRRSSGNGCDARVNLWKDGKESTLLVARLVAMTWCDGYSDDLTVNHIDGNPMNNNAGNLEWVSRAENIRKAFSDELYRSQVSVTLTDREGYETRFRSMADASRFLGKNDGYVSGIVANGLTATPDGYAINF